MQLAEKNNLLTPEQYGSQKNKAAITQCLNKRLFYDHHRYTCHLAVLCSNDANSCCDRIVLIIAALSLCHLGAPHSAVRSMIQTLAHLNHHIRMAFGDSESSQGFGKGQGIAGIGQGNGVGPHIWAAVSTPLFEIMRSDRFIAKFICALLQQQKELAGLAFVDDTDLIVNDDTNTTATVTKKMQQSLTMWHGLLQAMGGELVPEKYFWYLVDFKWANQQWTYKKSTEVPGRIMVMTNKNKCITIPRLEPLEAHHTLGVQLAPDDNDLEEAKHLQEVSGDWSRHMARANLTRVEAEFSLRQVLMPKLAYPLTATNLSEEQCYKIMKPAMTSALPAMGINRHFPRAVAHGPRSHQGLDIPNLFTEQLIAHISTLL